MTPESQKPQNYITEVVAKYLSLIEKEILIEMRAEIERQIKNNRI